MSADPSPTVPDLSLTEAERDRFLQDVRVGVVTVNGDDGRAPLASPVWYAYDPGAGIRFVTAASSAKARRLRARPNATFLVQDEQSPQRYVAVSGPASLREVPSESSRRRIAARYLPAAMVDGFIAATPAEDLVEVTIRPERWTSLDFGRLSAP